MNNKNNLTNLVLALSLDSTETELYYSSAYQYYLPHAPFYLTISPRGELSSMGNSEIVLVTSTSYPGRLSIVRGQKNTSPRNFKVGDVVSSGIYAEAAPAVGDIVMTLNATPASGRLFMDGGQYSRDDYPLLYEHIQRNARYGTITFDSFTLTDMRTRMPFGSGASYTLGSTGGFERTRHVNTLWGIAAGAFRHSGTKYLNSLKPILDNWLTGDDSSSELTYKSSVANVGGALGQEASNPIERLWYEYTSSNMPPYIVVNYEVVAG